MNTKLTFAAIALLSFAGTSRLAAQGTAFTYQGRLSDGGTPANGTYDLTFTLYAVSSGGSALAGPVTNPAVAVTDGLFTAAFDFGANFPGADRWLEIGVRTNGAASFSTLAARQKLTPTPYAITAGSVASGGIASGTYSNPVTFDNPANSFSGNGTGLTNVNASALGGLASSNYWQLNGNNVAIGQFLGTLTTFQPLEFRIGGVRALQLEVTRDGAPNVIGGSPVNSVPHGTVGAFIGGGGSTNYNGSGVGSTNTVKDDFGAIAGGLNNTVTTFAGTIGGGDGNNVGGFEGGFVGGGLFNLIENSSSSIAPTIGGGWGNTNDADYAVIAGGQANFIAEFAAGSAISGGGNNSIAAESDDSVIGGGGQNTIQGNAGGSVIGGGGRNIVAFGATDSIIGGGGNNYCSAQFAIIGGGTSNTNSGTYAVIPGGQFNVAKGVNSFAAGFHAQANHNGTFVWADNLTNTPFASTATNQFLIRASGGVGIGTTAPEAPLHVAEGSAGAVTANASSIAAFERSSNGYLSILGPVASETGILFGDPNSAQDGGIIFNSSSARSGLEFRTGTNTTQLTILANGNVGLGTTLPSRELEVQNTGDTEIGIKSTDTGGHLWTLQSSSVTGSGRDAAFQVIDRTLGLARIYVLTNGNVGIGRIPAANELELEGNASKTTAGSWLANSDARIKKDIQTLSGALDTLAKVRLVSFRYSDDYRAQHPGVEDRRYLNVVAQEFREVFPEHVKSSGEKLKGHGEPILQADTYPLTIYSAAAIQELNQKLEARSQQLEARASKLEAENAELKQRLVALEQIILLQKPNGREACLNPREQMTAAR